MPHLSKLLLHTMQSDTCPMEWYMSNGHSANLRVRQTSSDWLKVEFWITRSSDSRVEQFLTNQMLGDILFPGFWLVENCSTVRCICCHWTLYRKINFQPIRTCLTYMQFCGMTIGHVSFHWKCIALHSVSWYTVEKILLTIFFAVLEHNPCYLEVFKNLSNKIKGL